MGFLVMNKLSIYGSFSIDLNFVAHIFPKMACFCYLFWPAKLFTPTAQLVYISVISVTFSNSEEWKKCKKHYAGWEKNVRQRRLCVGDAYQLSYCNYHSKNMLRDTPEAAGRFFPIVSTIVILLSFAGSLTILFGLLITSNSSNEHIGGGLYFL